MENLKKISKLVESCRKNKKKNIDYIQGNEAKIKKEFEKVPEVFVGNSNLIILGSYNSNGHSFIELKNQSNGQNIIININQDYSLSCKVKNAGDLAVPSAKVEFYVSREMDIPFGDLLEIKNRGNVGWDISDFSLLGIANCWLNPGEEKEVSLIFKSSFISKGRSSIEERLRVRGNMRLFVVRVFSFSPLDIPTQINALMCNDNHIGFRLSF